MSKSDEVILKQAMNDLHSPAEPQKRKRGRPKGTTNKARMYDRGVIALMSCATVEQAASQLSITRQTLFNWLKDPEFLDKLDEARRMALGQAMIVLSAAAGGAVQTLIEIAHDKNQPGSTRTAAANSLITIIDKQLRDERQVREQNDRIQSLKKALDEALRSDGEGEQRSLPSSTTD